MTRTAGFTLIELLVVIAIIGILSAIVLASLGTARNKAQDAKVQSQIDGMRAAAEIYYGNNGNSFGTAADCSANLFNDATSGMQALQLGTTGIHCGSNGTAWAAAAPLITNASNSWCSDSVGHSKGETGLIANAIYVCP